MARSARMFEIIQILRQASNPCTAHEIADILEVTKRTIYRDIASLQAMRIPIEGEAGIGYIMRPGFDLPPINFDVEEAEAITIGLRLIARTGDKGLEKAARRAARKLSPTTQMSETLFSSDWGPTPPGDVDLSKVRDAIRRERKIEISYSDEHENLTSRVILPVAIIYYAESIVIAAWCELRRDYRHFRPDRFVTHKILIERFSGQGAKLRREWAELYAEYL
ncbi:MAG: YafY family transcriptional regulator [Rhizobiaceae bacterium]|nr:YafY family transcriptional regulator [Rhizobiaceae bacterium]